MPHLTKAQRLEIIIAISTAFFLAEIATGFYTKSIALIADAFHYLNDLIGFVVQLVAFKISERTDHPQQLSFGWQRANLLGAFFNGVFLLALGVSIFLQSLERFVNLQKVENPQLVLIIGCVGLTLNIISATFLHEHDHDGAAPSNSATGEDEGVNPTIPLSDLRPVHAHGSHRHIAQRNPPASHGHDLGLLGVLTHVLSDAANNVGVIIAASVIWKAKFSGRYYADPAISLAISLMIFLSSLPLVRKSGAILLESVPSGINPTDVREDIQKIRGVLGVHELHIWRLNQQKSIASAHVVVSAETMEDFMGLASTINECFHAYGVHSVTLQPELAPSVAEGRTAQQSTGAQVVADRGEEEQQGVRRRGGSGDKACWVGCRATVCEEKTCCD